MASEFPDDGFHEIQLNGKQLVFLFMAATVVSVVIFLCGVLVGRGVRAERAVVDSSAANAIAETTPQQPTAAPAPTSGGSDPTTAAPPPAAEDLSYFNCLEKRKTPVDELKTSSAKTPNASAQPASASSEPTGQGYAVQIAALNVRGEAEAIAKRLTSKGYAAYVLSPATGTPSVYRVRVGKFTTRREADAVAAKLQKEEQFKPWVTR